MNNSENRPKYSIGDNVKFLGLDKITCIVEDINKNEKNHYTYVLKISRCDIDNGPIDMSEIRKFNSIPEDIIVSND